MGLDALDVKYRIEKEFHVALSQQDLLDLMRDGDVTVGDLFDCLLNKLMLVDVGRSSVRLNYCLWEAIRRDLQAATQLPLGQIQLRTRLDELFPGPTRRAAWGALRSGCPYHVSELDYPPVMQGLGWGLAIAMVATEQAQLGRMIGVAWLWPVLGLLGLWLVCETYFKLVRICAPLRSRFPRRMKTVKDLCRSILAANYADVCHDFQVSSEYRYLLDERPGVVWQKLTEILANVLGVPVDEITFRSRLFRDLGMA